MTRITLIDEEAKPKIDNKVLLISESHQKARIEIEAEEQRIKDNTIDPESLKQDLAFMADLLKKSSPETMVEDEKKPTENRTVTIDNLKNNLHKLPKDEQKKVLSSLEDMQARNQKVAREESFKRLPDDIKAGVGLPASQLKMLKVDQRVALLKQLDNVLEIEKQKHQDRLIAEAIK